MKKIILIIIVLCLFLIRPALAWFEETGQLWFGNPTVIVGGATTSLEFESPTIIWDGNTGDLYMKTYMDNDWDDTETIALPDNTVGWGFVCAGADGSMEYAQFVFYDDAVDLVDNSTNAQTADADNKLVIGAGANPPTIKNQLGNDKVLRMKIHYYSQP